MNEQDPALKAIAEGDHGTAARLYWQTARNATEIQAQAFYATHAYVHALQAGEAKIEHAAGTWLRDHRRLR